MKIGMNLPIRNDLDNYKKTLMIDLKIETTKTSCEFKLLVLDSVKSLNELNSPGSWDNKTFILVDSKFGVDGSGSHQVRQKLSEIQSLNTDGENKNDSNYIATFWCLLLITIMTRQYEITLCLTQFYTLVLYV